MNEVEGKIASWIMLILNQKRCSDCLTTFSSETVNCEVSQSFRKRSTIFAAKPSKPLSLKKTILNRSVGITAKIYTYEPTITLKIECFCGNSCSINVPTNSS